MPPKKKRADQLRVGDIILDYGRLTNVRRDGVVVTFIAAGRQPIHVNRASSHTVIHRR